MKKIYLFILVLFLISFQSKSEVLLTASIEGKVLIQNTGYNGALVTLYQNSPAKMLQTTSTDASGNYKFNITEAGNYFVHAEIFDDFQYPNAVGTYYGNDYVWYTADSVKITANTAVKNININLIEVPNPQGDVSVSGTIKNTNGQGILADLLYVSTTGTLVRKISSNADGTYEFITVPAGTYNILVDTFGFRMESIHQVISSSGGVTSEVDYTLSGNKIKKAEIVGTHESKNAKNISLYPNPTTGNIFISFAEGSAPVYVYNALGQLVYQKENNSSEDVLNCENLPAGIYTLKAIMGDNVYQKNFIKVE